MTFFKEIGVKVSTLFWFFLGGIFFLAATAIPLFAQYMYVCGPEWLRHGEPVGLAISSLLGFALTVVCGGICISLGDKSIK